MFNGPFWSLSDPRRPKPNYVVDRTGPDWSFPIFPTEDKAKAFYTLPAWKRLKPIKIKTYEDLLGLLWLIRDVNPALKWISFHEITGKPRRRMISRLPVPKATKH